MPRNLRIVTWNVNSIRSRHERVSAWIARHQPDVLLLQETKCTDALFALDGFTGEYRALGYEVAHHGRDHWNGVAILSRVGLEGVQRGFPGVNRPPFDEARTISAVCGGVRVWSIYAPNGRELDDPHYLYKLVWFERLRASIDTSGPTFVAGDFNVAPTDLDIYDPIRWRRRTHASPAERAGIASIVDLGLVDITRTHLPEAGVYTWWSYRPGQFELNRGLRIDLSLCTADLAARTTSVWIDRDECVDRSRRAGRHESLGPCAGGGGPRRVSIWTRRNVPRVSTSTEALWFGDSQPSRRFPVYTRGNSGEVFPNVVSPLTGSFFAEPSVRTQTAMFQDLGVLVPRDLEDGLAPMSGIFGGYLYLNLSIGRLIGARSVGMSPKDIDQQMFGTSDAPPYRRQPGDRSPVATVRLMSRLLRQLRHPDFEVADAAQHTADEWLRGLPDVSAASDAELLALVTTFSRRLEGCFAALLHATAPGGAGRALVERLLQRKAGSSVEHLVNRLTGGLGTIDSALLARRLWAIGRAVAADPELTAAFDLGVEGVLPRLRDGRSPAAVACVADVDAFLAEHGHRGPDEYELATPNWRMEPTMALAAIDRLRFAPEDRSPELAQVRLAADRELALAEALAMVPRPMRGFFRKMLHSATLGAEMRERAKDAFVKELGGMRAVLHELVRRAQQRGGPAETRDCFLVTVEELPAFVADPSAFRELIEQRRARRDELQARVPPFWFEGRLSDPSTWELRAPAAAVDGATQQLHGIGVCQGSAAGPARVIIDPNDPGELQPGDVLIAPFTDPAWTPLFLAAAAVVVDVGAQQSHAAIVARELGIPAVVSVSGASRKIASGSWVTVNGDTGEVLVEPAR